MTVIEGKYSEHKNATGSGIRPCRSMSVKRLKGLPNPQAGNPNHPNFDIAFTTFTTQYTAHIEQPAI